MNKIMPEKTIPEELNAEELQKKLIDSGHSIGEQHLSLQTCRIMMSYMDEDESGKLDVTEFQKLEKELKILKREYTDHGLSQKTTLMERGTIPKKSFESIWRRHSSEGHLRYDEFVAITMKLQALTGRFKKHVHTILDCGCEVASLTWESFIEAALV
ncbi:hypothetical protein AAFF_G00402320 [Aldrovandia affinis]|uniref:EF-hand domain-containing protein n=1 Tax=Aldrovandia affinis TaxID=143900 RepID=A0AAD7T7E5_9TELE|nr:hypothetical protein AAFF_G00402320 [Aldrovandia affinis]